MENKKTFVRMEDLLNDEELRKIEEALDKQLEQMLCADDLNPASSAKFRAEINSKCNDNVRDELLKLARSPEKWRKMFLEWQGGAIGENGLRMNKKP